MSGYKYINKYRVYQRQKTYFEEKEQVSEPYITRMLELSDLEFETTIINMLRALIDKVDSRQDRWAMKQRDGNPNKEPKINARDQKCFNRNEECLFYGFINK